MCIIYECNLILDLKYTIKAPFINVLKFWNFCTIEHKPFKVKLSAVVLYSLSSVQSLLTRLELTSKNIMLVFLCASPVKFINMNTLLLNHCIQSV